MDLAKFILSHEGHESTCAPSPLPAHHTAEGRVHDTASVVFNLVGYTLLDARSTRMASGWGSI